jgi:hypothetical protein
MGMINWFKDFIPCFAEIAAPLTHLTKKSTPWRLTPLEQNACLLLLHRLTTAPVLRYFDPGLETFVFTDASDFAIGGWIGQRSSTTGPIQPCVYWSRKLIQAELNYPVHERELLALVKILRKHRAWLLSQHIVARTDHRSITHLQTQPSLSARQARWVEQLQDFNLTIEYVPGQLNQLADLLSRRPDYAPRCADCKQRLLNTSVTPIASTDSSCPHPSAV